MFFLRFFVFFLVLFNVCFFQVRIDGVVAIVGKNILLHSDVLQQAQFAALERGVDPSKTPYLFEEIYFNKKYYSLDLLYFGNSKINRHFIP